MVKSKVWRVFVLSLGGGVIGNFTNANLSATELQVVCANQNQDCTISQPYTSIENTQSTTYTTIKLNNTQATDITTFTNSATLSVNQISTNNSATSTNRIATFINSGTINGTSTASDVIQGYISAIENSGTISGSISILFPANATNKTSTILNSGTIYGISAESNGRIILDNRSSIFLYGTNKRTAGTQLAHLHGINGTQFMIRNYFISVNESQTTFNTFSGYTYTNQASLEHNSHLVITGTGVTLNNVAFESGGKITIGFGRDFELGKPYSISKIVTDINGNGLLPTSYFGNLISKDKDYYTITQSGDSFVINFAGDNAPSGGIIINTPITELYKSNIKTMNNFFLHSNAIIYPHKYPKPPKKQPYNPHRNRYSMNALESNETFSYDESRNSDSLLLAQGAAYRNTQRGIYLQHPRVNPPNNLGYSANRTRNRTNLNRPTTQSYDSYYFAIAPFITHNLYKQAGNYNLSGLDGGFITAFSGKLNYANALGVHFGFSYGSLGDRHDKAFSIKSVNLMLGLNYKLDLIYDMFIKARGDFFYFANEVSSEQVAKVKPNDLGFGISVAFGKDFDLGDAGILGAELGIDYKGLSTNSVSVKSALDNSAMQNYDKSLYNLIYADLGVSYRKYFGYFGLNLGAGIRGNLAHKLATSKVVVSNNTINILLDNDKFLGYANAGISYVLNKTNYAMEFGLNYYGNFGDRSMSNGGSLEFRVNW